MSELEALCHALQASVQPLPALVNNLQQRARRLRTLAAEVDQAARKVEHGPNVSRVVQGLHEAATAMDRSGQALNDAVQQSRGYVARTIGGGARNGAAPVAASAKVGPAADKRAAYGKLGRELAAALTSLDLVEGVWNKLAAELVSHAVQHATGLEIPSDAIESPLSYIEAFVQSGGPLWVQANLSHVWAALSHDETRSSPH